MGLGPVRAFGAAVALQMFAIPNAASLGTAQCSPAVGWPAQVGRARQGEGPGMSKQKGLLCRGQPGIPPQPPAPDGEDVRMTTWACRN